MPADISAAVPNAPLVQNTINVANIDVFQGNVVAHFNTNNLAHSTVPNIPVVARTGTAATGGNAYTAATLADLWMQMAVIFANNGTSKSAKYPDFDMTLAGQAAITGEHVNVRHVIQMMSAANITAREFSRYYANRIFSYGKANAIEWRVGKKNGIDQKYGYCGFDFVEYADGLNTHERAAADATTQVALSRASGSSTRVNNAAENTRGVINNPGKTLMF